MDGYMTDVKLAIPTALSFSGLFANEVNHFCSLRGRPASPCRNPAEDGVALMKTSGCDL